MIEVYPLNEEYLSQGHPNLFTMAQSLVQLAMMTLRYVERGSLEYYLALKVIKTYAHWQQINTIPADVKRSLWVQEEGEEAVQAHEEASYLCASCSNVIPEPERLKYPHWRSPDKYGCSTCYTIHRD